MTSSLMNSIAHDERPKLLYLHSAEDIIHNFSPLIFLFHQFGLKSKYRFYDTTTVMTSFSNLHCNASAINIPSFYHPRCEDMQS